MRQQIMGQIICKWDEDKNDFHKLRVTKRKGDNYILSELDYHGKIVLNTEKEMSLHDIKDMLDNQGYVSLKSDGLIMISDVVLAKSEAGRDIKDVIILFYKYNDQIGDIDLSKPAVIARQALNDPTSTDSNKVGFSFYTDDLPDDFPIDVLLMFDKLLDSRSFNYYKTDTLDTVYAFMHTTESDDIIKDLYSAAIYHAKKIYLNFEEPKDGYYEGQCKDLFTFLKATNFISDVRISIGIGTVDFDLMGNITPEQKLFISLLYGGIYIDTMYITAFDYTIDLKKIKMKHLLIMDATETLYLVGYKESDKEIVYPDLTDKQTEEIKQRIRRCINVYDKSQNKE